MEKTMELISENKYESIRCFEKISPTIRASILEKILFISEEAIIILDDKLNFVFANPFAKSIYLFENDDFLGTNYLDFCQSKNIQPFAPKAMFYNNNIKSFNDFKNSIIQSNSIKIIAWNILKYNVDGNNYFIAVGKDNTKFNNLEKKEKSTREYLQNIIQHIPGYIFWKDTNSILQGCNESFSKLTGETTSSIVGKTDYELPWKLEEAESFIKDDRKVMDTGIPKLNIVEPMRQADGSQIMLLTHKVPLRDLDGKIIGVVGICSDITEKIKAEEELKLAKEKAENASKVKNEFLQNMSHDIRTPFVGILGMSKLLYESEENNEKKKELGYIVKSSENLLKLLNEIIELVKIENGSHPVIYSKFNLKSVVNNVVEIMQAQVYQKNLNMIVNYADNIPEIVSDSLRIHRILLNLISNAVKFTNFGHIAISAEVIKKDFEIILIKLVVEDTGIGIPNDKFDYIFENFNKLSPSYNGIYKGSGFGLKIVKQFIEDINGKITVENKTEGGTKFICIIPCKSK